MKLSSLQLRNAGHVVLCAVDAETGVTLARASQPDLILMDIQLPGMDGLAATALLKQDPATAAIPIIALTAMAMKEDQQRSEIAGCDAYIPLNRCTIKNCMQRSTPFWSRGGTERPARPTRFSSGHDRSRLDHSHRR
jgi:two-component system cell cycle response regulator DivK